MNMPTRAFLQHYHLSISTLSPVHIGCGEDYEPTNYVMDEQCLHYFDVFGLADVLSDDDRKKLDQINQSKSPLLSLQKFFFDRKEKLIPHKTFSRFVAYGLYEKYNKVIGKAANIEADGKQVVNAFGIARTAHNSHSGMPIIPGSSLKGSIRTALLNKRNEGNPTTLKHKELEKDLLNGAFETDPMRLLKMGDAMFTHHEKSLLPRIAFENNVKRIPPKAGKPTRQLLSLMREVIPAFNANSFEAELSIQNLLGIKNDTTPKLGLSAAGVAKACNNFYLNIFKKELVRFSARGCLQQAWAQKAQTLLELLTPFIETDTGMVLRVGRHSGAESVTLDGVRSIKIIKGPGKTPGYESQVTTDWLAGDQEKSEVNLMPFGWVFVDLGLPEMAAARKKLTDFLAESSAASLAEQQTAFEKVNSRLAGLQQKQAELKEKEAEQQRRREQELQAELEKQAALARMSPEQQAIQKLKDRLEKNEDKGAGPGCKLADDLRLLCDAAASWSLPLKDELYRFCLDMLQHLNIDRKKNDKWKARLNQLKVD